MTAEQNEPKQTPVTEAAMPPETTLESALEQAKRAYALNNFDQAVEHYAIALELMTNLHGDASPECVDLYFAYGKALLENAVAQNSVLGKEETSDALQSDKDEKQASTSRSGTSGARIHFGEDAALEDENEDTPETIENDGEEPSVDLFAEAVKAEPDTGGESAESGDEGVGEPEDDFNAAWEVLEVARSLYEAQKSPSDETKLKLADTYIALGDVSLETEKLEQAVNDYSAAVTIKTGLLPLSSRQIAEVHYKLCIVYDMTPGRLAYAIEHAKKTEASVRARLNELTTRLEGVLATDRQQPEAMIDTKGKGKAVSTGLDSELSKTQLESEIKELQGLLEDVSLKIDELKSSPDMAGTSAPDLVARELDRELNGVKKKKAQGTSGDKRKADEEVAEVPEKKVKLEGAAQ